MVLSRFPTSLGLFKKSHELGKIATSIPKFDEQHHHRQESDSFKIKGGIMLALGLNNDISNRSDDRDDNDTARSTDSDENPMP